MGRLIFSLAIIVGGIAVGQILYGAFKGKSARAKTDAGMKTIRNIIVYSVTPVLLLGAFWVVDISNASLTFVPFICLAALLLGGALSLLYSKIAKHNKQQTGALFCCGSFSSLGPSAVC